ncbi:nucleoside deaminase [Natronogracilivirga saccharolytica]|uniref:Nucleoside deaminase n=1 Tax=Natronogracilivirga saccharolytica TaxID=2812953 RepID=A0A8J7RGD3_9BACT|nr:nucleoside deaminase [Natronogracilivirga saccharolytica]MBP3191380.1 nucleoside deaminase [Natronogracilivirga saccharolytica]
MDIEFLKKAAKIAREAEDSGNIPVGALITFEGKIISEGKNAVQNPDFHPGRHAEMEALRNVPVHLWPKSRQMTCYTTLEPCVMCFGSLILHRIGRVVYGAADPEGGARYLTEHLPGYYSRREVPEFCGPLLPELCDPLYLRAAEKFNRLINKKSPRTHK